MKESLIAFVRSDMVDDGCGYHLIPLEMKLTQRLFLKLMTTKPVATFGVIESVPGCTGCHVYSNKKATSEASGILIKVLIIF